MSRERLAQMAGSWYPDDPLALKKTIVEMLEGSGSDYTGGRPIALTVPHAGYIYSGEVAASGYSTISDQKYDNIVVIAPSHREAFSGVSLYDGEAYHTPLGRVTVNVALMHELATVDDSDRLRLSSSGHREEHSLELQLPFLQVVQEEFQLLPLVMGEQDICTAALLAESLFKICADSNCLIVASTDLSHFHSQQQAETLDNKFINLFSANKAEELDRQLASGDVEACGGGAVTAAMLYNKLSGGTRCQLLRYDTSARVTDDYENVVGYFSGVMT
jgi:hypothetical protein